MTDFPDYSFFDKGTNGKAVLLVHGMTGTPVEMKIVAKHLNKRGYTVYAPTLAGHCTDEQTLLHTTYEQMLQSLHVAYDRLKQEGEEIYVAGICVGGTLGLMLADELEQISPGAIKKSVIYSPALNYDGWNQPRWWRPAVYFGEIMIRLPGFWNLKFEERFPFGIKSDRIRNAVMQGGEQPAGALPYFPVPMLYQNFRIVKYLKKRLPFMHIPTLLIHSKLDDVAHPRNATNIQKIHGGPCEIVWLENSYHMIHVDQERKKVADLTADFFEGKDVHATTPATSDETADA